MVISGRLIVHAPVWRKVLNALDDPVCLAQNIPRDLVLRTPNFLQVRLRGDIIGDARKNM
eukprot:COSAG05_NODE_106_length_18750_cov_677.083105_10_plen_60_part_00